jgi:hypothetical protein
MADCRYGRRRQSVPVTPGRESYNRSCEYLSGVAICDWPIAGLPNLFSWRFAMSAARPIPGLRAARRAQPQSRRARTAIKAFCETNPIRRNPLCDKGLAQKSTLPPLTEGIRRPYGGHLRKVRPRLARFFRALGAFCRPSGLHSPRFSGLAGSRLVAAPDCSGLGRLVRSWRSDTAPSKVEGCSSPSSSLW